MAKINYERPAIDAVVTIAGAALLDKFLLGNVQFLADLFTKLPADVMGISVSMVVLGVASLVLFRNFIMKG